MLYVVGYGKFEIFRNSERGSFKIRLRDKPERVFAGEFWDFASARRECDFLKR